MWLWGFGLECLYVKSLYEVFVVYAEIILKRFMSFMRRSLSLGNCLYDICVAFEENTFMCLSVLEVTVFPFVFFLLRDFLPFFCKETITTAHFRVTKEVALERVQLAAGLSEGFSRRGKYIVRIGLGKEGGGAAVSCLVLLAFRGEGGCSGKNLPTLQGSVFCCLLP